MGAGARLYMYVVVVQKFTFAISSPDEFLLWPPCVADADIIFLSCGFYLSFFSSPNLSGRRLDVYHTSTHGVHGPGANLECRSEMYCTRLAGIAGRKKINISAPSHNFIGLYLRNEGTYRQSEKMLNSNTSPTCSHHMVNFGPLAVEICW